MNDTPVTDREAAALESAAKAAAMLSDTYRERAFLVALLAAEYPSVWVPDPTAGPGWNVVYIDLPTGQASWHISPDDWDLFGFVPQGDDGIWDGHTTVEKYRRVFDLTMNVHLRGMTGPDEQSQDERDARPLVERLPPEDAERVAVLIDERDCWRKEVLELRAQVGAQDERDGDVRAVAALLIEDEVDLPAHWDAVRAICDRFADRIAALEARDAKAGEQP